MAGWEYLEVFVGGGRWADRTGRGGAVEEIDVRGGRARSLGPLLDELGEQGWELVAVASIGGPDRHTLFFKRPKGEAPTARGRARRGRAAGPPAAGAGGP